MTQAVGSRATLEGERLLSEGRFEIGNIDFLLDLLASLEPDHIKAFVQFILNSFDAFSPEDLPNRTQVGRIEIRFKLSGSVPEIIISDYHARGMNLDQINAVPTRIGSSEKRQQWQELIDGIQTNKRLGKAGYQAVGVYVYRRLCQHVKIVTRHFEEGSPTYMAILPTKHGASYQVFEENQSRELSGTDFHLVGVEPNHWRKNEIDRMVKYFRKEFRHQLRSAVPAVDLIVITEDKRGQGDIRHKIQPEKFEGERLPEGNIFTKWRAQEPDPTDLELYYHPGVIGGKVEVWFGQSRVCEDITKIEGLDIAPFNSGELEGTVAPTFLIPDTDRHDFIRDTEGRFVAWIRDMRNLAKNLDEKLQSRSMEARSAYLRTFERNLRVAVREVANEFNITTDTAPRQTLAGSDEMPVTPKKTSKGKFESKTDQEILDQWRIWVFELCDRGITDLEELQKAIKREHKITLDKSRLNIHLMAWKSRGKAQPERKVADGEERQRRAEILAKFSIRFQTIWSMDAEVQFRSRYNRDESVIEINSSHPDYLAVKSDEVSRRKVKDQEPFFRYIAELVVMELTPVYYSYVTDTNELMVRFMNMRNRVWEKMEL